MSDLIRRAPPGKFRVIAVDTFDGGDWLEGDFEIRGAAIQYSEDYVAGKQMLKVHVYDDQGKRIHSAGTF